MPLGIAPACLFAVKRPLAVYFAGIGDTNDSLMTLKIV